MKITVTQYRLLAACAVAAAGTLPAASARADAVGDFYQGNQLKIIVGGTAGGGYAPYARLLQRHMGQYIPGKPNMLIQYMPGAGGLVATNFVANVAPKDGTVIGAVQRSIVRLALFGDKGAKYDPRNLNWLGSLYSDVSVCVSWHTSGINTVQDAIERESIIGAISPNNDTGQFPAVLNNIVGTKFKIISGYPGSGGITLAMARGEVSGRCGWSWLSLKTQKGEWLRDKKINVFVQLSLRKLPEIGDVPLAVDLAKTKEHKQILRFIFAEQTMGKPFMLPAGVPAERVAALRKAFMQAARDEKALSEMKTMKLEVEAMSGEEMETFVAEQLATPKAVIAASRDATTYKGPVAKVKYIKETGRISKIVRGGRELHMQLADGKTVETSVSGGSTKVFIGGKKAKGKNVEVGMTCTFDYPGSGYRSRRIDCRR
jgi:tripartite-type tricarboxylate transporter receptor subunit TctC